MEESFKRIVARLSLTIAFLLLVSLLHPGRAYGVKISAQDELSSISSPAEDFTQYLPFIVRRYSSGPTPFGVETTYINNQMLDKAKGINAYWLRYPAISWKAIEPLRVDPPDGPVYHWEVVNEAMLAQAAAQGITVIAVIKYTPDWAQKYPGYSCGPVAEEALDEFAGFIGEVVSRYSLSPYNIHYWEIGNEPDVDPYQVAWGTGFDWNFGCWGDQNDPYYGGGYYAEMLKQVYPAIKAADPQAQILIGGLLLDCDPTHPLPGTNCLPGKFFEGILHNGGAEYFNVVSYHGYALFLGGIVDEKHYKWGQRGGVVLGKANYLREVMTQYGVNKPIFDTEAALACHETYPCKSDPVGTGFLEAQADYVVWLYVRNWANNINVSIWFTLNDAGWRQTGLLRTDTSTKLAYTAYQFLTQEIGGGAYVGPISKYPELRTYEFEKGAKRIWVMWAPDQVDHIITLPNGTGSLYDKYGNVIEIPTGQITTTVNSPIYIEFQP